MKPSSEATTPLLQSVPSKKFHRVEIVQLGLPALDDGNVLGIDVVVDHRGVVRSVNLVHVRHAQRHHDAYLQLKTEQMLVVVPTELPSECLQVGKVLKEIRELIDR